MSSLLLVRFTSVSLLSFSSVHLLTVFSTVNNVLPSLQRLRGGAGGKAWLGWWSALFPLLLCVFLFNYVLLCFRFSSSVSHGALPSHGGSPVF